jgi:hypothetical protein
VTATIDGINVTISGFPGLEMTRPTSAEWTAIARQRGQIFLSLTTRTWPDGPTADEPDVYRFIEADDTINSAVSMLLPVNI